MKRSQKKQAAEQHQKGNPKVDVGENGDHTPGCLFELFVLAHERRFSEIRYPRPNAIYRQHHPGVKEQRDSVDQRNAFRWLTCAATQAALE